MEKSPRQIWYGIEPGSLVNLAEKRVYKAYESPEEGEEKSIAQVQLENWTEKINTFLFFPNFRMVRHKQAFLGLTWQSMRTAMKKDPNRIAQYKLFNKTLNKEFQTTLADPSRLINKNELKHSEHTGKV